MTGNHGFRIKKPYQKGIVGGGISRRRSVVAFVPIIRSMPKSVILTPKRHHSDIDFPTTISDTLPPVFLTRQWDGVVETRLYLAGRLEHSETCECGFPSSPVG